MTSHDYHRNSPQRSRTLQAHAAAAGAEEDGPDPLATRQQADGSDIKPIRDTIQGEGALRISGDVAGMPSNDTHPSTFNFQDLDYAAEQPLKDPKSFTQNLFDTLSLRMVEWLPLRRATENVQQPQCQAMTHPASDEIPNYETGQARGAHKPNPETSQTTPSHTRNPPPRTPSSRPSGTRPSAVEPTQIKRLSITEVPRPSMGEKKRAEYKSHKLSMNAHLAANEFPSIPSPPALKHRPQKHRGRTGDLDKARSKDRIKNQRRVSWDSEKLLTQAAIGANPETTQQAPPHSDIDIDTPTHRKPKSSSMRRTANVAPLAQSVSHFTPEIIDGLSRVMISSDEDAERWREELDRIQSMGSFDNPDWKFATPRQRLVFPFVAQSAYFVFSSTGQILRSFGRDALALDTAANKMNKRLDLSQLQGSLQRLFTICPWDIALHSLWSSLDKLFVPPDELMSSGRPSRRSSRSSTVTSSAPPVVRRLSESANNDHLSDADAAYIATVALFVLVSSVPDLDVGTWRGILRMRAAGTVASSADMQKLSPEHAQQAVEATDRLEHELGLRMINRLVRALAARLAYHEISKARQVYSLDLPKQRKVNVLDRIMDHLSEQKPHTSFQTPSPPSQSPGPIPLILEWLRTLFLREWDGNPEMARSSAAGGALQILALMYKERSRLGLFPEDFHTPILAERLDPLEMPVAWLGNLSNNRTIHILSYPFLFPPSFLVIYFRALNYSAMSKYYEAAMTTTRHVTQTAFSNISIADDAGLLARMKISMSTYLVLVVRRDSVLTDALNQLWRREKRELMRPLKVQMGMDEGEEGLDHGGVQQEFFRVLMGEALDPSYGMFTIDSRHRISWFQPCSWEPLYKFELLGLLMSIAVYNGITLPVNFPVAFYRKLLGLKVKHLDHIRDGWPELSQGLDSLLTWDDGDVGDIFMRTYEFSFESAGSVETVDMQKVGRDAVWPSKLPHADTLEHEVAWSDASPYFEPASAGASSSAAPETPHLTSPPSTRGDPGMSARSLPLLSPITPTVEAALVTNQNRNQFVKDYIFWLTDKSIRPQFEAFLRGFHTCLDRTALSIFTPEALKTVVEGIQEIDITQLEHHARYEGGFGPGHRVIRDFWSLVHQYPPEKKAQLLEFVTASDRIPVNGISSIMFVIQKNGVGDLVSDFHLYSF